MEYTVDFDINKFEFWSGAKDRVDELDYQQLQQLGEYIEECLGDRETPPTETEINDFVWFSCDDWFDQLEEDEEEEEEEDEDEFEPDDYYNDYNGETIETPEDYANESGENGQWVYNE